MNTRAPFDLLAKFITGQSSPEENIRVREWINQSQDNLQVYNQLKNVWDKSETTDKNFTPDIEKALDKLNSKLNLNHSSAIDESKGVRKTLFVLLRIAAFVILIVGSWIIFNGVRQHSLITQINDTGAPLNILLPDNSNVTLNKGASLIYPRVFKKHLREVQLNGEAFFQVLKVQDKPFFINAGKSYVRVLGTSFNVRALKNEDIVTVTVEEGRVEFGSKLTKKNIKVELTQGESGILEKGTKLRYETNSDVNFLAWKTGKLIFNKTTLGDVTKAIEKYYHLNIQPENNNLDSVKVDIILYKVSEDEIIRSLEMLLGLKIIHKDSVFKITAEPI
jgi:transmembrane sensor